MFAPVFAEVAWNELPFHLAYESDFAYVEEVLRRITKEVLGPVSQVERAVGEQVLLTEILQNARFSIKTAHISFKTAQLLTPTFNNLNNLYFRYTIIEEHFDCRFSFNRKWHAPVSWRHFHLTISTLGKPVLPCRRARQFVAFTECEQLYL